MKIPSKNQWKQFLGTLNKKEKIFFSVFAVLFFSSLTFLLNSFYLDHTKIVPASGGTYTEGLVGFPRFINPVYSDTSDVDKALTELIFSGLMKYDKDGKIITDLAESYKILENGKIYEFTLQEDLVWQDSKPLTIDDVIFTVETIQNPEIKSALRSVWLGISTEKVSDLTIRFTLKNESSVFLENSTLKIIPKHVWEKVPPASFALSSKNLEPIGSGPYKLEKINQDSDGTIISINLGKNQNYNGSTYISNLSFKFFQTDEELIKAYNNKKINGLSLSTGDFPEDGNIINFSLPRYFAVFLNLEEGSIFEEKNVRLALNYGTDKEAILNNFFLGKGEMVNSPILPNIYGFEEPSVIYEHNIEKANELLDGEGFLMKEDGFREKEQTETLDFSFKNNLSTGSENNEVAELQRCLAKDPELYPSGTVSGYFGPKTKEAVINFQEKYYEDVLAPFGLEKGTGSVRGKTRDKLNEICFQAPEETIPLAFSLFTVDQPMLTQIAEELKTQWETLGFSVTIQTFNITTLEREILRERSFDSLLFGEMLSAIPDPFPFWHSTQNGEMGLNLSNYNSKNADILLEDNRKSLNEEERKEKLEEFQDILLSDCPAIFLYNPNYRYLVSKNIKGISSSIIMDVSERFYNIENWHINTRRIWK